MNAEELEKMSKIAQTEQEWMEFLEMATNVADCFHRLEMQPEEVAEIMTEALEKAGIQDFTVRHLRVALSAIYSNANWAPNREELELAGYDFDKLVEKAAGALDLFKRRRRSALALTNRFIQKFVTETMREQ